MKKIIILTMVLVFAATSCFALVSGTTGTITKTSLTSDSGKELHGSTTGVAATIDTALIGKNSTGVGVAWKTQIDGYTIVTQHKSGTKAYGSSYDSTALFQYIKEGTPGTPILAVPTATDTTDFTTAKFFKAM